jgi:hypothetical protein
VTVDRLRNSFYMKDLSRIACEQHLGAMHKRINVQSNSGSKSSARNLKFYEKILTISAFDKFSIPSFAKFLPFNR